MDALLVRERYKVVRVIDSREDYAFAEAVDILDRETGSCLLNLYEGPLLRRYLPCFDHLKGCAAFQAMFLEGESLVAVFRDCSGTPIDQVFYLGDDHSWRDRLYYAGQLCREVLNLSDLPTEAACALLLSENVLVDRLDRKIALRFHLVPMEEMNFREAAYLAGIRSVRFCAPGCPLPGRSWSFSMSWIEAAALVPSSFMPFGAAGRSGFAGPMRPWRRRILSAAGVLCWWGVSDDGVPGGREGDRVETAEAMGSIFVYPAPAGCCSDPPVLGGRKSVPLRAAYRTGIWGLSAGR